VIYAVVDETWRESVTSFVCKRAFVYELKEASSFIGFVEDGKVIGGILFTDYDGHNIYIHLALSTPRICQRRFIRYMFDYCFKQLRCGRITAVTVEGKKRSERLIKGVGFTKEGIVRKGFNMKNKYVDAAVYGMLREECKWL
jgi:RimJ/RimL family protein N-acetyltransferase